jgi:hypothetical protein
MQQAQRSRLVSLSLTPPWNPATWFPMAYTSVTAGVSAVEGEYPISAKITSRSWVFACGAVRRGLL